MEKEHMQEETSCPTTQLVLTWRKLNSGKWDREVLGDMPEGANPSIARANAARAIEKIVGEAELDRIYHTEALKESTAEWFRWYTVGRFRYEIRAKGKEKRMNKDFWISYILGVFVSILIILAFRLLVAR